MASSDPVTDNDRVEPHNNPTHVGNTEFRQDVLKSLSTLQHQPVEMADLSSSRPMKETNAPSNQESAPIAQNTLQSDLNEISPAAAQGTTTDETIKFEDESAIGPATERPLVNIRSESGAGPQLVITLLLHPTDTRHPFIIRDSYLKRRNVQVADNDPVNMTVYNLKDLIWRDWRNDWEARPATPTSIRLIHMGRMLDDKANLKDSRFASGDTPHVVHMSIKPQEVADDEDARMAKGSTRDRDDAERRSGCRCVVM